MITAEITKPKSKDTSLDSFSKRLNYFLDKANFPPIGAGRAKSLADRFGGSKSGAQNWIGKNHPPKRDTLKLIVTELLKEIYENINPTQVIAWLEHGNAVTNPFATTTKIDLTNLPIASKHVLLSRIYIDVHRIAKQMGVDIYSLDDEVMDHVYNSVIRHAIEKDRSDPDPYLISSLLELAVKSPKMSFA